MTDSERVTSNLYSTDGASPPSFTQSPADVQFTCVEPITVDEVVIAVKALPDKCCALDPLPATMLTAVIDDLAPFLTALFNRSLSPGYVPAVFKAAYISPRLKKVDMDSSDVRSYRPISNLSVRPPSRLIFSYRLAKVISKTLTAG